MKLKKSLFPVTLALALGSSLFLTGCDNNQSDEKALQLPSVNVTVFETKPLDYTVKVALPARVVASQIAEIRPQVGGIILKREFEESSNVTEGQSLYQIDPAIYQANYDSALASVASAEASAKLSQLTLNRYINLLKNKSISQQDYDKAAADSQQAHAAVLVAKANLHTAKVNLDYTKVYSPIDGYIGKSNVTEGALVGASQSTAMAIVQKLDPIYVDMTQSVSNFEKNEKDRNKIYTPNEKVEIFFNDGSKYAADGHLIFSDKNVSETTGTVILRAQFANPNSELLPGMFIKPLVTLGNIKDAILVPQKGITSDQAGNYTTIVAVPIPKDQELTIISDNVLARFGIPYDGKKPEEKKAAEEKQRATKFAILYDTNSPESIAKAKETATKEAEKIITKAMGKSILAQYGVPYDSKKADSQSIAEEKAKTAEYAILYNTNDADSVKNAQKTADDKAEAIYSALLKNGFNETNELKVNNQFYYFEKRSNIQVYSGLSGYWVVTSGINAGEKVVVTGLLNLSSLRPGNNSLKTFANIVAEPGSLSQEQLDQMIENNVK